MSVPEPSESWRWGGPGWRERAAPGRLVGIEIAIADPDAVSRRWVAIAGGHLADCSLVGDEHSPGLAEIQLELDGARETIRLDGR